MFFRGDRKTVPASRYGAAISIIEATGWTYAQVLAQPDDLIDEFLIRLQKRARVQKEK
jgi:hypothetical protein